MDESEKITDVHRRLSGQKVGMSREPKWALKAEWVESTDVHEGLSRQKKRIAIDTKRAREGKYSWPLDERGQQTQMRNKQERARGSDGGGGVGPFPILHRPSSGAVAPQEEGAVQGHRTFLFFF